MKKELFFAIGAGLILGLIIAFGIWRVNKTMTPSDNADTVISQLTPSPDSGFVVTIANVDNLEVVTENPFNLSGLTKPNTKIAISAEEKDYIFDSDKDGGFEKEVSLVAGLNEITIKAFQENGAFAETKIQIVYSSEFKKYIESDVEEKTATDEADSVRLRVEEKIADASKNPKSYIGTITDISESTYQIKNLEGEIEQVSFTEETDFIKVDKTSKVITSEDVAIGDSIITMGFKNGNSVLQAKRILVTEIDSDTTNEIYMAKIIETTSKQISVINITNQEEMNFTINTDTDFVLIKDSKASNIKLADLDEDQIVYIFSIKSDKSSLARTIYLIEESETPSPTATSSSEPEI